jgi:hypothetical protein
MNPFLQRFFHSHKPAEEASPIQPSTVDVADPLANFTQREVHLAALDLVWPLPSANDSFWGGSIAECDRAEDQVEAKRLKYRDYEPIRMRKEIMSWLDYAWGRIQEARSDVETQKHRREMDKYLAKQDAENERKRAVLNTIRK